MIINARAGIAGGKLAYHVVSRATPEIHDCAALLYILDEERASSAAGSNCEIRWEAQAGEEATVVAPGANLIRGVARRDGRVVLLHGV
jgi:hypothetical protein